MQEQLQSLPAPSLVEQYLSEHGFDMADQRRMLGQGFIQNLNQAEAEQRCGKKANDLSDWQEFIWLPRRKPSGDIVLEQGQLVMLKKVSGILGDRVERDRLCPPGHLQPNHISFYGDDWYGFSGEIVIHESSLKAQLEHLRTGANTVGLNGVNGLTYKDREGVKRIVEEFAAPPWDQLAELRITFDSPSRVSPESTAGLARAKQGIVTLLGGSVSAIFDSSLPPPTDSRVSQDINDLYLEIGDAAFLYLAKHKTPLLDRATVHMPKLVSASEVLDRDPPNWVVHELIASNELTLIVGPTSCGKSFFAMDLLLAIATNRKEWFGHAIRANGFTVHMTLEGAGMSNRLRAYRQHNKLDRKDIEQHLLIETPINMRDADVVNYVIGKIEDYEIESGLPLAAIAIDTVNRAMNGGDENSSVDMGKFIAQAERIKSSFPNSAVILVHHLGKDPNKGGRGHSSLSAAVGGELQIKPSARDGIRNIHVAKQREGKAQYTVSGFSLDVVDLGTDSNGDAQSSCVVVPCTEAATIDDPATIYHHMQFHWAATAPGPVGFRFARDPKLLKHLCETIGTKISQKKATIAMQWAEEQGLLKEVAKKGGHPVFELARGKF